MQIHFHGQPKRSQLAAFIADQRQKDFAKTAAVSRQREEANRRNRTFPFDPAELDLMILSHAHIDHSGNIPNLVKVGFQRDMICTPQPAICASICCKTAPTFKKKMPNSSTAS